MITGYFMLTYQKFFSSSYLYSQELMALSENWSKIYDLIKDCPEESKKEEEILTLLTVSKSFARALLRTRFEETKKGMCRYQREGLEEELKSIGAL
jgi:stalled ribosome alternative rescue factor ArfA